VRVTDNGTPSRFDEKTFHITVVSRPLITAIGVSNNVASLRWSALIGQVYRLQFKTNLDDTNWTAALPDLTASGSSATQTNPLDSAASRFYRVVLVQ